jgi:hypothetical protein
VTIDVGDVAVRARGLATHLLPREVLCRLARSAGTGVLAGALRDVGYWPAPSEPGAASFAVESIESSIEYETMRRLRVLGRWLGPRRAFFAGVFDDEERRALRIGLRRLAVDKGTVTAWRGAEGAWALPQSLRAKLAQSTDPAGAVRALRRLRSPWAQPLGEALRVHGAEPERLEAALDRAFAQRALSAARRVGGRLLDWVADGIDLENAWDALLAGRSGFIAGGARLPLERYEAILREPSEPARRRELADSFARTPLEIVFADDETPVAGLEARAVVARIAAERRAARRDPVGVATILEWVMRLRGERADLRRINWGIAQGVPASLIVGQLVVAR